MSEHPFASYVRILGKGPNLSRALTLDETRAAVGMILKGEVEPVQLGAFLCLMRVKTETPAEVAGFALAIRDNLAIPGDMPPVDLDWPSYAGKSRQLPMFLLSALLLAENGVAIAMHGIGGHTAGRLYSEEALAHLGIQAAQSLEDAARQIDERRFTYVPMQVLHPALPGIMGLKRLLGLRSPLHTVARNMNPFDARVSLMSVFHPNYRAVHRDAAKLMDMRELACFKGEGGEIERRPEKPCLVEGLRGGEPFEEEWSPTLTAGAAHDLEMDPARLAALWRGEASDPYAEATVRATTAVALRQLGRAGTMGEAEALAVELWNRRRRKGF
ncbi:glycosyl transferase family protein [Telmatospirillum siberiense]|uniref:Glycosyl transferase family protein n=1 Tax=Telmatospirillum siberiense TaxID=382514 RepID=A0A2N3PR49_9PROT|nr:glycosyl transferase family protein [Telmatospirillum siberiense]PKU22864.1 glycosyl transferase family protein [Telmatospirillum siberiense]